MIYFKANNTEYPASIAGKMTDREWDNRESKAITLGITYAEAAQLFVNGLSWSIVQRENEGSETTAQEWDNSDYCVAGSITDNRDGTITAKMGKKTASDVLAELEAAYDGN